MTTLEPGRPIEGVFAVRRKERRMSRKGSPYLALTLGDATGTIPAASSTSASASRRTWTRRFGTPTW